MKNIYVVAAKRTPFGRYHGLLSGKNAVALGEIALTATLESINLNARALDGLFMGNVLGTGLGQNMARQVALKAGMTEESASVTVNEVCGSSLKALRLAQGQIELGDLDLVAVGGAESMTNAPYFSVQKNPAKPLASTMLIDGLQDPFSGKHMGLTAENIARKYQVSREEMDLFSLQSHRKASRAVKEDFFKDEIVPLTINGIIFSQDENIRADSSLSALAKLPAVFSENGQVTAGNSSPLSDGASVVLLASEEKVQEMALQPLARLGQFAESGTDPAYMGYAPYYAVKKLLQKSGRRITDYDAVEINEAFAAQAIAVARDLQVPEEKLNLAGGAIALGHPLAASGTRLVMAAISSLKKINGKRALVTLCIGGGQAIAYEVVRDF
ncbi:thiolase family protein [Lactobacillus sp. ESL0791]|uniref:thiolase family protein n=1 Tax=Lactobacillus sp. ESL0791 TaxID=2983234 RepID=UPI0023F9278A|nr:thiolase family protein [Lactobacillus sp. ESL0791]MDF7638528.1 thiolase family protein [Lactobacillus sp. ESL0791]